jgi:hypothetical protein
MRKAYHLEREAAVLHVFSVECAVLQLSLLSLFLLGAPLRVRSEHKSKRFFKIITHISPSLKRKYIQKA